MNDYTIADFLNKNAAAGNISFHMPGHKGRSTLFDEAGYGQLLKNAAAYDITEIPGADSLYCPRGALRNVMDNYAELYGVRHTELLVNGSSAGLLAAIISSVPVGGKLILSRNSHHAAFSALRLGGINPVYVRPETDPYSGLVSEISSAALREACRSNPDADAVLITSPNYYGMLSDISSLATVCHDYDMILIVDQAHGAHLKFFDNDACRLRDEGGYVPFPYHSAEALGADIVINSTHKTLLSFTGSGIMNICTDRVDISAAADALRMLQTTSPSYILMGSLDVNERIMRTHGSDIIRIWRENLIRFYRKAIRINGLEITGAGQIEQSIRKSEESGSDIMFPMYQSRSGLDLTKINISMAGLGISGEQLDRELRHRGIISEMVHGEYVMLMTGAGNIRSDYDRLLEELAGISESYGIVRTRSRRPQPAASPGTAGAWGST